MKNKKLTGTLLLFTGYACIIAGILTAIPWPATQEINIIGYKSLCSFAPVSTIICLIASNTFLGIRKKKFI